MSRSRFTSAFLQRPECRRRSGMSGTSAGGGLGVPCQFRTQPLALATQDTPHCRQDGLAQPTDGASTSDDELADAESAVQQVEGGKTKRQSPLSVFIEVATLIFLAEWGDRSMLATIALGAAQNPVGVAVGAIGGHAIATGIAVLGGGIASKYVSERTVNIVSGVLFLLFAAATAFSMF
ncbi:hypothetical protein Vafri_6616 [Volvox africanus]|uniref:GDT1 family protein n=1 Tax=Volvox africanus TaxID=51714 RepID=A0A8J4EWX0_9CHLO|nr:hypothetical protein Vafri_6616 [Volvox africanus]